MYFNFNLSPAKYIWRVILFINYLSNHHHSFHINIVNYACRIHLPFSSCLCFFFVSDELLAFNEGSCFHFFVHCSFIFFLQQGCEICVVWRFHGNRVVKFAWSVVFMATKLWISKSIVFMATKLWISKSIVFMATKLWNYQNPSFSWQKSYEYQNPSFSWQQSYEYQNPSLSWQHGVK